MKKMTVIIPAFNEDLYIEKTIKNLKTLDYIKQIIVMDDGSTDNTYEVAKKQGVEIYKNVKNIGKGKSIENALQYIKNSYVALLDADLGESVIEVDKLMKEVYEERCDVAIAKFPYTSKGGFKLVQSFAKWIIYYFTGEKVNCPLSGQRVMKSSILKGVTLGEKYGVEINMTIDLLREGYRIMEVPVKMTHRELGKTLSGFLHRGIQLLDILKEIMKNKKRWKKKCG